MPPPLKPPPPTPTPAPAPDNAAEDEAEGEEEEEEEEDNDDDARKARQLLGRAAAISAAADKPEESASNDAYGVRSRSHGPGT